MTSATDIKSIHGANLSDAWAQAFIKCCDAAGHVMSPGIVSFDTRNDNQSWELESSCIRTLLEDQLNQLGIHSVSQSNIETVAGTIFPESIWTRCNSDRQCLFHEYNRMWPLVNKCSRNSRGTYFRRLTAFGEPNVNQLEKIIEAWNAKIRRHSAFQAGVFDPAQDHRTTPYLGFPCLQQVVFHPSGPNGSKGMSVVAFYANQLLLEKAYGNYLGLYRLGKFMAGEMGLTLTRVTCIASDLSLSYKWGKGDCEDLIKLLGKEISNEH